MSQFKYRMLGRKRRTRVRELAREAYLASDTQEQAIELARRKVKKEFKSIIVEILIGVLIQLAIDLIVKWIMDNLTEVPTDYQPDEPGYFES